MTLTWTRGAECLSDLRIDRLASGELELAAGRCAREHLASCERCSARFDAIQRDAAAFRSSPPRIDWGRALRRASLAERVRRYWAPGGLALAAAAALLLLFLPRNDASAPAGDRIRRKGGARIGFFVKRAGGVHRGVSGATLFPGDSVRFTIASDRDRYVAIVGIDGANNVTVYHPRGDTATRVAAGRDRPLRDAFALDDVVGTERIAGFFCTRPLPVADIEAAFAQSPHAPTLAGCAVDVISWEKRRR